MANYTQQQLPGEVFNSSNGDIRNYNGRAVRVTNPGNGTRDLEDLGDYGSYQSNQNTTDLAAKQKGETDARFAANRDELTNFNNDYQNGIKGIVDTTSSKYNLPALLEQANGLNTRVQDLSTNMNGTASGGYASGAQVDRAIQTNYLPRAQQATSNLQTGTALAQNEESQLFKPWDTRAQSLTERLNRESTGYTAEQKNELDAIVAKIQAGAVVTAAEIEKAKAIAVAEKDYQARVDAQKLQNQNVTLQPGSIYYNPSKGASGVFNPYGI